MSKMKISSIIAICLIPIPIIIFNLTVTSYMNCSEYETMKDQCEFIIFHTQIAHGIMISFIILLVVFLREKTTVTTISGGCE